jgi:signal transduction histidine kinase
VAAGPACPPPLLAAERDIRVVVGELNRLRRLSERLLVIAASASPEFLRPEAVALDRFTADLLRRWRPTAGRRWQLGRLDEATVAADGERLRLALDALLENAVQHTGPDDAIRLSVERHARSALVGLVVEDSGPGIAPAAVAYIFDRFRTGSGAGGRAGTGLGLPLVQAVARGHGGDVGVHSSPGQGSRFELMLPDLPAGGLAPRPAADGTAVAPGRAAGPGLGRQR